MNCNGGDILNIDIDPDFLISLVGKLSLDNIPDFSETLQSIENNTGTASFETKLENDTCSSSAPFECDKSAFNQAKENSFFNSTNNEGKDGFLSSIGLLSAPNTTETPLPQDNFLDDASALWNTLAPDSKRNKESCQAKENLVKSKEVSSERKTNRKKAFDSTSQENTTCDKVGSHWQGLPILSGANFPHKSVNSLQDVFSQRGMVFDIQLSDIGSSLQLPLYTDEGAESSNSLTIDKKEDLVGESACSPDSVINTSPCPTAISPHSPPTDLDSTDDSEEYDDSLDEDDLERILAELIEVENSLRNADMPQSTVDVPVLKNAKNAEDHIEKILNFLKEPLFNSPSSEEEDFKPGFPELLIENTAQRVFKSSSKVIKKPSPKSKKHKFGFEFKYAGKNELRHSSIFSKGKHLSSRNKILKQIQKDERIQKQVEVIEKLVVSRKLKRTDTDNRESKKRRIQRTDWCNKSQ